ncbi:hypothetical protein CEXT_89961 [Caerostris extrusa]|uniref:Uncharacterized protein n=1 Tax=Caerostris extrusa TaxID=172846 RepID=A0AAV4WS91_CAEEX|nr:hypothetical protein CEXT_89961 [Caerostris extrusa]
MTAALSVLDCRRRRPLKAGDPWPASPSRPALAWFQTDLRNFDLLEEPSTQGRSNVGHFFGEDEKATGWDDTMRINSKHFGLLIPALELQMASE